MNNYIDRKIDGCLDVLWETDIKALNCSVQSPLRIKRISWLTGDSEHTIYIHSYILTYLHTYIMFNKYQGFGQSRSSLPQTIVRFNQVVLGKN